MLSDPTPIVKTIQTTLDFTPSSPFCPLYRLIPVETETGKYHCLLFYVTAKEYLILEPKIKRYLVIKNWRSI